jgi:hypothetical protein
MATVSDRLTHITEISRSRLKEPMPMLLDPTVTSSSTEKCLECQTNGAG